MSTLTAVRKRPHHTKNSRTGKIRPAGCWACQSAAASAEAKNGCWEQTSASACSLLLSCWSCGASGLITAMTVLGGSGSLLGPVMGVALFEILKEQLSRLTTHWYGVLGLIFILATIYMPAGIAGLLVSWFGRARGGKS